MNPTRIACPSVDELAELLEPLGDVPAELAKHLEECPQCARTLDWLAGDQNVWNDLQSSLQDTQYENYRHQATVGIVNSICALSGDDSELQDPLCEHEIDQLRQMLKPASHPELLGQIGRYELEQLIGRGGMGLVFRAYDSELHRIVAIKTLAVHLVPNSAAWQRFVRESRACASLVHPHIVPIHDVITEGPVPALVMQLIAGPTLQEWLAEHGSMSWEHAAELMVQLLDGLSLAHEKGFVHRDIKPGNVLLEADASRAMLTDFGLVRTLDDATLTHSGMLAGTPDYMSPEQARGQAVGCESDLFSLGALFYHALAGYPPFRAEEAMAILNRICHEPHRPLCEVNPAIPLQISQFVDALLKKELEQRIASATDAKSALEKIMRSKLELVEHSEASGEAWRLRPLKGVLAATLLLLVVGLFAWAAREYERFANKNSTIPGESDEMDAQRLSASGYMSEGLDSAIPPTSLSEMSPVAAAAAYLVPDFANLEVLDSEILQVRRQTDALLQSSSGGAPANADWTTGFQELDTQSVWQSLGELEQEFQGLGD